MLATCSPAPVLTIFRSLLAARHVFSCPSIHYFPLITCCSPRILLPQYSLFSAHYLLLAMFSPAPVLTIFRSLLAARHVFSCPSIHYFPLITCCSPRILLPQYSLFSAHYLLLATYSPALVLTICRSLLAARHVFSCPSTHYFPLITYCSQLFFCPSTHCYHS